MHARHPALPHDPERHGDPLPRRAYRLAMARRHMRFLLRGVSDKAMGSWTPSWSASRRRARLAVARWCRTWKPRRRWAATCSMPRALTKEILLLLLISEALACARRC